MLWYVTYVSIFYNYVITKNVSEVKGQTDTLQSWLEIFLPPFLRE